MNRNPACGQPYTLDGDYYGDIAGPYAGVGPKNYRRSPVAIREDVCQRFADDPDLDAGDIEVDVDGDCEVTLRGSVENRRAKRLAEDLAAKVAGVCDVHNRLKVSERRLPG